MVTFLPPDNAPCQSCADLRAKLEIAGDHNTRLARRLSEVLTELETMKARTQADQHIIASLRAKLTLAGTPVDMPR